MLQLNLGAKKPDPGYTILSYLGRGEYGAVHRVRMANGEQKAAKITFSGGKNPWHLNVTEMNILNSVNHPHVLKADKIIHSDDAKDCSTTMILPLADSDLDSQAIIHYPQALNYQQAESKTPVLLQLTPTTTPTGTPTGNSQSLFVASCNTLVKYLYQAAYGLYALHMAGFLHLDIKGGNILIFGNTAKLADFSTSAATGGRKSLTMGFVKCCELARPPENKFQLSTGNTAGCDSSKIAEYSEATDVWSFGVLILSTFAGGADRLWGLSQYSNVTKFTEQLIAPQPLRGKLLNILAECFKPRDKRPPIISIVELLEQLVAPTDRIQRKSFKLYDNLTLSRGSSDNQSLLINQVIKPNKQKFVKELDELRQLALVDDISLPTWLLVVDLYYRSISLQQKLLANRHMACYWLALRLFQEKCYESRQAFYVNESVNTAEIAILTHLNCCLYQQPYLAEIKDLSKAKAIHDMALADPENYCLGNFDKLAISTQAKLVAIKDIAK